jgi:hypothetical protein
MSIEIIDTDQLNKIEEDITKYLFDRHHEISKPLIMDLAYWVYGYGNRKYLQAQFDNDIVQTTTTFSPEPEEPPPQKPVSRRKK